MSKSIHIKVLLLFSLSILFGYSAFSQNITNSVPAEQHVCVGADVNYTVFGFPNSTIKWYIETNYLFEEVIPNNVSNVFYNGFEYNKGTLSYTWDGLTYIAGGSYMLRIEEISETPFVCSSGLLSPGLRVYVHTKPSISSSIPTDIECSGDKGSLAVSVSATVPTPLQLQYRLVTSSDVEVVAWLNDNLTHDFINLDAGDYKVQIRYVLASDNSKVVKGSYSESSVITINSGDNVAPVVSAASDVVTTTSSDGTGNCEVVVAISNAIYGDNCSNSLTWAMTGAVTASGIGQVGAYTFPLGITTITYTNTDGTNSVTDIMTVTVTDDEIPMIIAPADVTVNSDAGICTASSVILGTPVVADNCSVATVYKDAPTVFPLGETTVTWTVTDGSGLQATATQIITVNDNTPPVITACPSDIVECATNEVTQKVTVLNIDLVPANYSDNCGGVLTVQYQIKDKDNNVLIDFGDDTDGNASGFDFPEGVNTVTYRVIDIAKLFSECSFTVEVKHKPVPSNITF